MFSPGNNSHHADPTGVRRGQLDMSARLIRLFEKLGWATDVRRPRPDRLDRLDPSYTPTPQDHPAGGRNPASGAPYSPRA